MNEIFISYSRKDKPFIEKLDAALRAVGRDPWVDWDDIPLTDDWRAAIGSGIESADNFIFVISPDSAASEECGKEVTYAKQLNKRFVPIVYREVSNDLLPDAVKSRNYIFMKEGDDFDENFKKLIKSLDTDLEWVKAHTRLTRRAVEWENKKKNESYLLRGDDLAEAIQHLSQQERLPKLTHLQDEYIKASNKNQEAELAQALKTNKKLRRRALYLTVALVSVLVLFFFAIIFFWNLSQAWTGATKITESFVETGNAQANAQMCRVGAIHDLGDEVFAACNRAIELDPNNSLYYENRALVFMFGTDMESTEQAIEDLRRAIDLAQERDQYEDKIDDWQSWIEVLEAGEIPDIQEQLKEEFDTSAE